MDDRAVLERTVGLGADVFTAEEVKKEASGVGMFALGFLLGAVGAAAVTYFWLEDEKRTVYADSRAYRYGKRPGSY